MSIEMVFQLDADLTLWQLVFEKRVPQQLLSVWPLFVIFYQTIINEAAKLLRPVCSCTWQQILNIHTKQISATLVAISKKTSNNYIHYKLGDKYSSFNKQAQAYLMKAHITKNPTQLTTFLFWALVQGCVGSRTRPSLDATHIMLQKTHMLCIR